MSVSITGTARASAQWIASLAQDLPAVIDQSVEESLAELIHALEAVTPVRTGRMKADYTIGTSGPGQWLLLNSAEAADGYPYPARVFDDPHWSRQYGPLNQTLDEGIARLERGLDLAIERRLQAI